MPVLKLDIVQCSSVEVVSNSQRQRAGKLQMHGRDRVVSRDVVRIGVALQPSHFEATFGLFYLKKGLKETWDKLLWLAWFEQDKRKSV